MAFNVETFKTRALTAVVFVLVMLSGLFLHGWGFVALCFVILLGCLYEYQRLLLKIYPGRYPWQVIWMIPYIIFPLFMLIDLGFNGRLLLFGWASLQPDYYSPLLPCGIFFSIWINDTMAYIVGSFVGKTPFSSISPKKTWEGTIGGAILCMVVITLLGNSIPAARVLHWQHWLMISTLCAVFGTLGDLLESKLKRMAGVKDSGQIMPGHGGFLDRFDSLLLATPAVWIYLKIAL